MDSFYGVIKDNEKIVKQLEEIDKDVVDWLYKLIDFNAFKSSMLEAKNSK